VSALLVPFCQSDRGQRREVSLTSFVLIVLCLGVCYLLRHVLLRSIKVVPWPR
jgi:hypothetical protein